jgi:phage gpG-like protein
MKVQVEIHSNLDFEKATEKQLKRVMYRTILDIGRDAHKDVRKTFKTNTDITGKGFKTLNEKYEKSKFKNKNKILTLMGDLAQSIQMRTNEPNMTVSVGSTIKEKYPQYHLFGEGDNPQRKWIYTTDELKTMFTSEKMLLGSTERALKKFIERFIVLIKTKMRKIGTGTTLDL